MICIYSSIYLSCVWSNLSEDIVTDSESFCDLNPQQSTDWSITINNMMDKCDMRLARLLERYTDEMKRTISVGQLLVTNTSTATIGGGAVGVLDTATTTLLNEELRRTSLQRLTKSSGDSGTNLASKINLLTLNDAQLPLDKGFMEFILDCKWNNFQ
jgi:hypothetical protein